MRAQRRGGDRSTPLLLLSAAVVQSGGTKPGYLPSWCQTFSTRGWNEPTLAATRWWARHPTRQYGTMPTYWSGSDHFGYTMFWCGDQYDGRWAVIPSSRSWPPPRTYACDSLSWRLSAGGAPNDASEPWYEYGRAGNYTYIDFTCGGVTMDPCYTSTCSRDYPQGYAVSYRGEQRQCMPVRDCGADTNDLYATFVVTNPENLSVELYRDPLCGRPAYPPFLNVRCDHCSTELRYQKVSCDSLSQAAGPRGSSRFTVSIGPGGIWILSMLLGIPLCCCFWSAVRWCNNIRERNAFLRRHHASKRQPMLSDVEMTGVELGHREALLTFFRQRNRRDAVELTDAMLRAAQRHSEPSQFIYDRMVKRWPHCEEELRQKFLDDAPLCVPPTQKPGRVTRAAPSRSISRHTTGDSAATALAPMRRNTPQRGAQSDAEEDPADAAEAALAALCMNERDIMGSFAVSGNTGEDVTVTREAEEKERLTRWDLAEPPPSDSESGEEYEEDEEPAF
eukprot:TRINITY_DN60484_c0_g1_i1.p1 TRINITY_DN60484_c0_g1~~TRINITY_DN60484_c0_g1_i1.p1  ORF type:complete len:529 (+),score=92.94 TRINITY_DN60484_c0_g1_i1:75-1589(+)